MNGIDCEMLNNIEHFFSLEPEREHNMWGLRINFGHEKMVKKYAELLIAEIRRLQRQEVLLFRLMKQVDGDSGIWRD